MNARRQALAARYHRLLQPLAQRGLLELPQTAPGAEHVYQMYTVLVDPARRDQVLRFLRRRGVGASVHFDPPVHLQPLYRELGDEVVMEAESRIRRATQASEGADLAYCYLGKMFEELGDEAGARKAYEDALSCNPRCMVALEALEALSKRG